MHGKHAFPRAGFVCGWANGMSGDGMELSRGLMERKDRLEMSVDRLENVRRADKSVGRSAGECLRLKRLPGDQLKISGEG